MHRKPGKLTPGSVTSMLQYRIDGERRIVWLTGSGALTVEEVLRDQDRLRADPDFKPDYALLADYRAADLSALTAARMRLIATRSPLSPTVRRAFVVRGEANFGLGRMFETYNQLSTPTATVRIFQDLDAALAWLAEPRGEVA
jgi:hypothetical protein